MDEILKEAYLQKDNLIKNMNTVILSTKCDDAIPNASYAPSVLDSDGFYYIYISRLSKHANNLLNNKNLSVMIIEDESKSKNLFARKRLTMNCDSNEIIRDSENWNDKMSLLEDKFGEAISYLKKLTDFHLFQIEPKDGLLVYDFARAFRFKGRQLDEIFFLNDKGHTKK
tara:strand:- start:2967 stop:3476 length:510 start_codon:yes stop_codon:yes gene_type:complete